MSKMWSPTHVQVLVKRAKGLILKGKNNTNDAFVTIALGKEKYQTSVKKKVTDQPEWCEQCELVIPSQGNTAEIVLTVLHQNFLGVDEFLGMVTLPLKDFDVHERPKSRIYPLKCKPGQTKTDYRGELEVRIVFTVKSTARGVETGSTMDLKHKDKNKGSLQSLNKAASTIGGSLLSLGTKEKKHLKKLASKVSQKVEKVNEKAKMSLSKANIKQHPSEDSLSNKFHFVDDFGTGLGTRDSFSRNSGGGFSNRDPGVNSDEDEEEELQSEVNDIIPEEEDMFKFDQLSYKSSGSSLNVGAPKNPPSLGVSKNSTPITGSLENIQEGIVGGGGSSEVRRSFQERRNKSATLGRLSQRDLFPAPVNTKTIEEESPVLDEWEAKLLGKKGAVPYKNYKKDEEDYNDTISLSQISQTSQNSNTLDKSRSSLTTPITEKKLTSTLKPLPLDTPTGRKKIIPVPSDFDSSTSPESLSSPSAEYPFSAEKQSSKEKEEVEEKKKKSSSSSLGLSKKLKSGYRSLVDSGKTGSLFNLNQMTSSSSSSSSKGFKDKEKDSSTESISGLTSGKHSRTHSDGSGVLPPSGTRVVLGRETTPTPSSQQPSRVSKEAWDRFDGKSREDLIEMIMELQSSVDSQARKQSDLEDYIDSLLMKVIASAPSLLQKEPEGLLRNAGLSLIPRVK